MRQNHVITLYVIFFQRLFWLTILGTALSLLGTT